MRTTLALLLLLPAPLARLDAAQAEKPNIVVFLADDMGWGDSATYGHKLIQTPNLNKLASQGVKFTQCYSACGVCSPSRSAMLTGRTPYRNGVYRHLSGLHEAHLRASEITYPKMLKSIGYETCHVGKWHLNSKPQFNTPEYPQPGDHGYDYWMATHNNAEPSHKDPNNFVRNGTPVGELKGFSAALVAAEATRWLSEVRDESKPFALSIWVHEPHSPQAAPATLKYLCPMCPGVVSNEPGDCPNCGMALERNPAWKPAQSKNIYTCPMHPEVQQDHPGDCPKCGMTLEPKQATAGSDDEENAELRDMTTRFWIGAALTLPVFILAMAHMIPVLGAQSWVNGHVSRWLQFALTLPVVCWAGWPFFKRGWRSVVTLHLNMFTLIAIGVGAAFAFSAVAMFFPNWFPDTMRHEGKVGIYFEAAAMVSVLVLLGQVLADKVAGIFVPAVLAVSVLTFIVWLWIGPEPRLAHAIVNAVAVLIIACPCALGLATPMSIMVGVGRGAQEGVLVKNAEALEQLEKVTTLVVDKTGTLTEGKPKLMDILPVDGFDAPKLLRLSASLEQNSEHPLAAAIVQGAKERNLAIDEVKDFRSVTAGGVAGTVADHAVLVGKPDFLRSENITGLESLEATATKLQDDGKTVMFVAIDGKPAGMLAVADPIKATTAEAIKELHALGLEIVMLTGDNRRTAAAVVKQLGLDAVEAEIDPAGKVAHVKKLRAAGKHVAMAGDGINDAPALSEAEVGIAMGTGTDVAMQSAGIKLVKGDLRGIAKAIHLSRATMWNIRQNLFFAFLYNALGIPVAAGVLYPFFGLLLSPIIAGAAMSLSSVSVISNALRLRNARL